MRSSGSSDVLSAITSEPCGELGEQLATMLMKGRETNRKLVIKRFMNRLTVREIDSLVQTLQEAGFITVELEGKDIIYTWKGQKT